jgi:DNA-binding beta-propeller fold protein YncE
MKQTRVLFILLAIALALGGCAMSQKQQTKIPDDLIFPPPPEEPRYYFERSIHSSADVKVDTTAEKLERTLTGASKFGVGMSKPYSIAVRHGVVYVGDTVNRSVHVFDIPGGDYFKIGEEEDENGNGKLQMPLGITLDKDGNLYVFDGKLKEIIEYDSKGKFIRTIGDPNQYARPAGLAINPENTRLYAVDIGGSSSNEHRILVYDLATGKHLFDIGKRGTDKGEFNLPRDVAFSPDGSKMYVVDGGNFRVQVFTQDGKFLSTFGAIGRQPGQFARPKEVSVDPEGNIYVVDATFGNFQIFNAKGQLLLFIGTRSNTDAPAKFSLPAGIAVDDDGRIYVTDQFFRKVDVFRPVGLAETDGYIGTKALDKLKANPPASSRAPTAPPLANPASPASPNPAVESNDSGEP